MIHSMLYDPAEDRLTLGAEELIAIWAASDSALIWVDFYEIDPDREHEIMRDSFGLHPLAIQDAQRDRHPAKVEPFAEHTFILLKGLNAETQDINFGTIQIALFVAERFLVTRHTAPSPSIERMRRELESDHRLLQEGTDALVMRAGRYIVNRFMPILLDLEVRLDELETEMIQRPNDTLLSELVGHKSKLKKLRRVLAYHVQVFASLRETATFAGIGTGRVHEILDLYEQQERAMSLATLYHDLASDLQDGYLAIASHRLNNVMKVLTIITAIFVPLGFLAGIYGMNFEYIPELKFTYGYFTLLGTMALIATVLLVVFKRKSWL